MAVVSAQMELISFSEIKTVCGRLGGCEDAESKLTLTLRVTEA
jgi:hypothetical protein